jgi:hypothetical protein
MHAGGFAAMCNHAVKTIETAVAMLVFPMALFSYTGMSGSHEL